MDVYQGDSSLPIFVRPDIADETATIDDDWVCETSVTDKYGNEVIAKRTENTKTEDDLHFVIQLSPSDTAGLNVDGSLGEYVWVTQMKNNMLTPAYNKEIHTELVIKKQGA